MGAREYVLLIVSEVSDNLKLSSRNVEHLEVNTASALRVSATATLDCHVARATGANPKPCPCSGFLGEKNCSVVASGFSSTLTARGFDASYSPPSLASKYYCFGPRIVSIWSSNLQYLEIDVTRHKHAGQSK